MRQYSSWDDPTHTVTVRQITADDYAETGPLSGGDPTTDVPIGTWIVETKFDLGNDSTIVDLQDIIKHVLQTNPALVEQLMREVNAQKALGDSPTM